ncbi:MAG TPA: LLM class flavin-dependent oxidoreductase [Kineosporiaceae bacterium]
MSDSATSRRFRFAVVAVPSADRDDWVAQARQVEELGYDTLLVPDTAHAAAPLLAAAVAAACTTSLRVGSYVLAPLRPPGILAWEAQSLQVLTGDRFELGLGAGRPDAARDAAALGIGYASPSDRIAQVAATVSAVRARCGDRSPRILIAGSGSRLLALAGRVADTVALALGPRDGKAELAHAISTVREAAGPRFDDLELSMNLLAVGDGELPASARLPPGLDPAELMVAGSVSVLTGTPAEMAGTLSRRRDVHGVSYLAVSAGYAEIFAPVVERLAGS